MRHASEESLRILIEPGGKSVSAVAAIPPRPFAGYVFAHGAAAGMTHDFMVTLTSALLAKGVAVLRYNFVYMEAGRRAPDRQPVLVRTVRAAVAAATDAFGDLPLFAGGKSMGGRMASIAQSSEALCDVSGLVFFGFPLHAAGRPSSDRAAHLQRVTVPVLFVQGTRDRLADIDLIRGLVRGPLRETATLDEVESGDHSLKLPTRRGRSHEDVLREVADRTARWMSSVVTGSNRSGS